MNKKMLINKRSLLKLVLLGVVVAILMLFTGCIDENNVRKYNVVILKCDYVFNRDFINANRTRGAYYCEENYNIGEDLWSEDLLLPATRTFIVKDNIKLQDIFGNFPEIDLQKEMIIVHGFTTTDHREESITDIRISENKLLIEYGSINNYSNGKHPPDASMPRTKWIVVKMDKLDIDAVEFEYKGDK